MTPTLLSTTDLIHILQDAYSVKHISIISETKYSSITFSTDKLVPSECDKYIYLEDDNDSIINVQMDNIKSISYLECDMHDEMTINFGDAKMVFMIDN